MSTFGEFQADKFDVLIGELSNTISDLEYNIELLMVKLELIETNNQHNYYLVVEEIKRIKKEFVKMGVIK